MNLGRVRWAAIRRRVDGWRRGCLVRRLCAVSPGCATAIAAPATPEDADAFLDRFMPEYDVVERHHINVAAPADVTFAAL